MKIYESIFHWKSRITQNHQAPGCVRIHIRWVSPPHASPPPAVAGPAEGYFICANPSAVFPVAHPPKSGMCRLAFLHLSAASPRHMFAPLSATGQGFGQAGRTPEKYICFNKCAGMHSGARVFTPEPRAPPPLDLDRIFLKARALATHCLCLFCLHRLLQDLFILLSTKV